MFSFRNFCHTDSRPANLEHAARLASLWLAKRDAALSEFCDHMSFPDKNQELSNKGYSLAEKTQPAQLIEDMGRVYAKVKYIIKFYELFIIHDGSFNVARVSFWKTSCLVQMSRQGMRVARLVSRHAIYRKGKT